jgi:hypothetical protein
MKKYKPMDEEIKKIHYKLIDILSHLIIMTFLIQYDRQICIYLILIACNLTKSRKIWSLKKS